MCCILWLYQIERKRSQLTHYKIGNLDQVIRSFLMEHLLILSYYFHISFPNINLYQTWMGCILVGYKFFLHNLWEESEVMWFVRKVLFHELPVMQFLSIRARIPVWCFRPVGVIREYIPYIHQRDEDFGKKCNLWEIPESKSRRDQRELCSGDFSWYFFFDNSLWHTKLDLFLKRERLNQSKFDYP